MARAFSQLLHRQAQELVGLQILIHIGLNDVLHREFPVADYLLLELAASSTLRRSEYTALRWLFITSSYSNTCLRMS